MVVSNPPPPSTVRSETPPPQSEAVKRTVIRGLTGSDEAEDENAGVTSPVAPGLPAAAWTPGTMPGTSVFGP